ncbi:DUF1178 family protein [Govanella unica]|uniref:DUF1178 family protein n=1 Tax=Govanella unica TaxID=2975056 RepID=A0A9X3TV80_9PROT|nr:DUF1178 family protein [Govania unica]MDA5192353.1 DUF1178 family protein [Govania unica]
MIVFDLKCSGGHVFEAWFASSSAYEEQRARDIVSCPICGATDITKAPMAPNISTSRAEAPAASAVEVAPPQLQTFLENLRAKVESEFDYVGDRFAEEARKIHYGESDARPIYGEATGDESRELREEGVEVLPLPFTRKHDA